MDFSGTGLRYALRTLRKAADFTVAAVLASYIPARRATRIDPIGVLRDE